MHSQQIRGAVSDNKSIGCKEDDLHLLIYGPRKENIFSSLAWIGGSNKEVYKQVM